MIRAFQKFPKRYSSISRAISTSLIIPRVLPAILALSLNDRECVTSSFGSFLWYYHELPIVVCIIITVLCYIIHNITISRSPDLVHYQLAYCLFCFGSQSMVHSFWILLVCFFHLHVLVLYLLLLRQLLWFYLQLCTHQYNHRDLQFSRDLNLTWLTYLFRIFQPNHHSLQSNFFGR